MQVPSANNEPVVDAHDPGVGVAGRRLRAGQATPSGTWPPTVPGWTVKDQLSHLIGIERMLLGDPPPPPLTECPRPRHQRLRGDERGVGGGPPARARRRGAGRVRRGHQPAARGPAGHAHGRASTRSGGARSARCPTASSWRPGSSTAGPTSRTSAGPWAGPAVATGSGEATALDRCERTMPFVVGKRVAPPDGTSVLFAVIGVMGRQVACRGGRRAGRAGDRGARPTSPR